MLKRTITSIAALALGCSPFIGRANDIESGKEEYKAAHKTIPHLGTMSGWGGVTTYKGVQFHKVKGDTSSELVTFEEYGGGTWTGPADQTVAFGVTWDEGNLYLGVIVTDEYHQNSNSGWNGDALQIAFANEDRSAITHLYNFALDGNDTDGTGALVESNEKGPGGAEVHVTRNKAAHETYYEIRFPASALPDNFGEKILAGTKFGLGLCVNDGDEETPGQKGWGGWGAHSIVFGKTAAETGLVTLEAGTPLERRDLADGTYQLDMKADAEPQASITIDGRLDEWAGKPFKGPTPFQSPKRDVAGNLVYFQEYDGGTWTGPADQTVSFAFAYDADNIYLGVVVTDDYHQNNNSGWNGDALQVLFANDVRDTVMYLYNYGLNGKEDELGDVLVNHEKGPGGTEAAITRDTVNKKTYYEIKFPASALEVEKFAVGQKVNVALCVNDGDEETPGQKGWSGWGPHAIVFGKSAEYAGEVTLVAAKAPSTLEYTAKPASLIKVDGNASDWTGHTFIGPVAFGIPKANPTQTVFFEEYAGGTWTGPADQTVLEGFAWSKDSLYVGVVVTDDYHQNNNSGWNGDAVQLLITNEERSPYYLYNYAIDGKEGELGGQVKLDERTPAAGTFDSPDFTVARNGGTTVYEVRITPGAIGLTEFVEGQKIGLAFAVNDGDEETPGQKGWGGFSPHALVFGKSPDKVGTITLGAAGGGIVKPTPTVSISSTGGSIKVTYVGTLQSATSVAGPYTDVAGATSPYTASGSGSTFFRARQ